jgi:DNA excision repair protein ERCC-1
LHPEYIFSRIASLANQFVLRVLLVLVDVETHQHAIRELTRVAMVNDLTLICAWSNEEAARYIETYKAYENKAPDAIKERVENDYLSKLTDGLTQIPSINKTDIITLSSTFGVSYHHVFLRGRNIIQRTAKILTSCRLFMFELVFIVAEEYHGCKCR